MELPAGQFLRCRFIGLELRFLLPVNGFDFLLGDTFDVSGLGIGGAPEATSPFFLLPSPSARRLSA